MSGFIVIAYYDNPLRLVQYDPILLIRKMKTERLRNLPQVAQLVS